MADQEIINLGIVGILNKGEYNSETNYEKLNVVTYNGSSYCALQSCKGISPINTDYWQLYAEKGETGETGPQGPAPVKGVDYYTATDKTEIENDLYGTIHEDIINQLDDLVSATPLAVSSTSEMTDTSRIYVNTTDGKWYYYNSNAWIIGGTYQSTEISDKSIHGNKLSKELLNRIGCEFLELKKSPYAIGGFSYNRDTNIVSASSNNTRIRFSMSLLPGVFIKFSNPNNLYKYGLYATDSEYNGIDIKSISDYNSSYDDYYVLGNTSNQLIVYRISLGFSDDRVINTNQDLQTELYNSIKLYRIKAKMKGENITNYANSILNNNYIDLDISNIPYKRIENMSISDTEIVITPINHSIIFPIEDNKDYYVKFLGNINRSYIYLLRNHPFELLDRFENNRLKLTREDCCTVLEQYTPTSNEFVVNSLNGFKYVMIYYYHGTDYSIDDFEVQISELEMPTVIEPPQISYPMFNTSDIYFDKIPNKMSRSLLYSESEYTGSQEMQGLATDGTYLYYCMHGATDNNNSCVGKISKDTGEVILKKNNTSYRHANGICYYPRDNTLYVASLANFDDAYPDFYILDADTLEQTGTLSLPNLKTQWENYAYINDATGIGAIAYSEELDRFIVLIKPKTRTAGENSIYGLAIYTSNWNLDKLLKFENPDDHAFRGGLWANKNYIYIVSELKNPARDMITIVDYNGNTIEQKILTQTHTGIEGIVVDYANNTIYTSNSNDKIYKFSINSYKNVPFLKTIKRYNLN